MVSHRRGWETSATSTARHGRLTLARRRSLAGFLFVVPGIVPLLIFVGYPMLSALYLSFTNWNGLSPTKAAQQIGRGQSTLYRALQGRSLT